MTAARLTAALESQLLQRRRGVDVQPAIHTPTTPTDAASTSGGGGGGDGSSTTGEGRGTMQVILLGSFVGQRRKGKVRRA
jgi:hypothetical protein